MVYFFLRVTERFLSYIHLSVLEFPYIARTIPVQKYIYIYATRGLDRFVSFFPLFDFPRRVLTRITIKSSLPRTELAAGPADACQKPLMVVAIFDGDAVTTDAIAVCSLPAPEPTPSCCSAVPAAAGPTWSAAVALVTSVSTLTERRLCSISRTTVVPLKVLSLSARRAHRSRTNCLSLLAALQKDDRLSLSSRIGATDGPFSSRFEKRGRGRRRVQERLSVRSDGRWKDGAGGVADGGGLRGLARFGWPRPERRGQQDGKRRRFYCTRDVIELGRVTNAQCDRRSLRKPAAPDPLVGVSPTVRRHTRTSQAPPRFAGRPAPTVLVFV